MGGGGQGIPEADHNLFVTTDTVRGQLQDHTNNFAHSANQAAGRINADFMQHAPSLQTQFGQYNPNLSTEFKGPQFSNQLDSYSQNVLAQGVQAQNQKLQAVQKQIAQRFQGQGGLSQILQSQAAAQSQLASNPLLFQAATAQRGREGQEWQMGQQAQAQTNQARLAQQQEMARLQQVGNQAQLQQTETRAGLQNAGNAAINQSVQLEGSGLQARQGLMAILAALSQVPGYASQIRHDPAAIAAAIPANGLGGGPQGGFYQHGRSTGGR